MAIWIIFGTGCLTLIGMGIGNCLITYTTDKDWNKAIERLLNQTFAVVIFAIGLLIANVTVGSM